MHLELIKTQDGSSTLFNPELDETYHSVNGAITESLHVFIQNGLQLWTGASKEIHVLEVGMGTGLNALLTMDHIPKGKTIFYTALEPFPIGIELAGEYFASFRQPPASISHLGNIHRSAQDFKQLQENFIFRNTKTALMDLSRYELETYYKKRDQAFIGFDIIYYDAFGPGKQPDMWLFEPLKHAVDMLNKNGLLVSYCAQGQFKRHLKTLELRVESPAGPPGKRQMTVAFK